MNRKNGNSAIAVSCAILEHQGRVLVAQRGNHTSNAGLWEFPGGKQEPGESPQECLKREIREELGIDIQIEKTLKPVLHHYPDKIIILMPFVCSYNGQVIIPCEHNEIAWVRPANFKDYKWSAADIKVWLQYHKDNAAI